MTVAKTVSIRHLATTQPDFEAAFQRVLHWSAETDSAIEQRVADILTDVRRRVWPARPAISPRRPARDPTRPRRRLTPPAQAFAGHAEDHWINVVTS